MIASTDIKMIFVFNNMCVVEVNPLTGGDKLVFVFVVLLKLKNNQILDQPISLRQLFQVTLTHYLIITLYFFGCR